MEPFKTLRSPVALLDWTDVNTDLIIPARYLKRVERIGYGPLLFADKRYLPGGAPAPDDPERGGPLDQSFPLNDPAFADAAILLVGRNFGCGSSREHAVWAVSQDGYRVLVAPGVDEGFADIFEGNAFNNGLLPIELPDDDWRKLADAVAARPGVQATVDLLASTLTLHAPDGDLAIPFSVPDAQRHRLVNGLDAISETLAHAPAIAAYERAADAWASLAGVAR